MFEERWSQEKIQKNREKAASKSSEMWEADRLIASPGWLSGKHRLRASSSSSRPLVHLEESYFLSVRASQNWSPWVPEISWEGCVNSSNMMTGALYMPQTVPVSRLKDRTEFTTERIQSLSYSVTNWSVPSSSELSWFQMAIMRLLFLLHVLREGCYSQYYQQSPYPNRQPTSRNTLFQSLRACTAKEPCISYHV